MNLPIDVTHNSLLEILLKVASIRPIFIWGDPGIGKSALLKSFSKQIDLPCFTIHGHQLVSKQLQYITQVDEVSSKTLSAEALSSESPYILFLDDIDLFNVPIQDAFYHVINGHCVHQYIIPEGSYIIGVGSSLQNPDNSTTIPLSLMNRMFHVQLQMDSNEWLEWAKNAKLHPLVIDYITQHPDELVSEPPEVSGPYSTPRSWHMLSDALKSLEVTKKELPESQLRILTYGCLSPDHAEMFLLFMQQRKTTYLLSDILKGTAKWPSAPDERDILCLLAKSFRVQLSYDLPSSKVGLTKITQYLSHRAKALIKELSAINIEIAQMVLSPDEEGSLPMWFIKEFAREYPQIGATLDIEQTPILNQAH